MYAALTANTTDPTCRRTSKQRVIDKFVVGYGTDYQFRLSVVPEGMPDKADIIVSVNGIEIKPYPVQSNGYTLQVINNQVYVNLNIFLSGFLSDTTEVPPVVEIDTYSWQQLDPAHPGYFQIPQQLEANPNQLEVGEVSGSEITQHFISIIENQKNFSGTAFGASNNYNETEQNRSQGSYVLQNLAPALKSMLISSSNVLDFIPALRFSQDEYSKFKSRYINTATQLIKNEFNPTQYYTNTVIISAWVEEILKIINVSREFSNAFAYSYMIANGTPQFEQTIVVPTTGLITLANYLDLEDTKNALYVYDITGQERLLTIGQDYEIAATDLIIQIQVNTARVPVGSRLYTALYKNPLPAYVPSTPSKVGAYVSTVPRMELDTSYAVPTFVIIGHDCSKTVAYGSYQLVDGKIYPDTDFPIWRPSIAYGIGAQVSYNGYDYTATAANGPSSSFPAASWSRGQKSLYYGDYRDQLLLELETRIYNLLELRFRQQYFVPLRIESIKPGYFRTTRYTRDEYLEITESNFNKWTAKFKLNYRTNNFAEEYAVLDANGLTGNAWKLYNYTSAKVIGTPSPSSPTYFLPGNWKGIFQYYYDTYNPDTRPWEMLGFGDKPSWWELEYGAPVINGYGQAVWKSNSSGLHSLYGDLEAGIIRRGPSAVYDPITKQPIPQPMWARPGLSQILPVDTAGNIKSVISIFNVVYTGDPDSPFDGFDEDWTYGDGAPVEQAWMSNSWYPFALQEFMYLTRPGPYGELLWDTVGTEVATTIIDLGGTPTPVLTNNNWQYLQNEKYASSDPEYAWQRPKNKNQQVHAETVDGEILIRFGYQRWISDRILFLNLNIADEFGQKIRTLDVALANKLAGFTNKDTTNIYMESVNPSTGTSSLILPSNNFEVRLHNSQPVKRFVYSGVIIRALTDGRFAVYGYDLLNPEFAVLGRTMQNLTEISVGGTPAEFSYFESGRSYKVGELVRYNGIYYESLASQTVVSFAQGNWKKLKALPTVGGVSVSYKPIASQTLVKVPYGTVFDNVQSVFDMLIGWGDYLAAQGWDFTQVSTETNQVSDWLYSAKQFLFWLNTNWSPDASIQLSPLANRASLTVDRGYPNNVETISNGVYSILDKYGVSISSVDTVVDRSGKYISVEPATLAAGGIYFLQITSSETEHVLIFDNTTSFNDVIYSPLLRARQQRLKFFGFRSNNWYGKMEAPGYLIIDDQLVPNYDTIVSDMSYYYDSNKTIDNPSIEDLARSLIGYESKSYLDNLELSNNIQYLFYQGAIRQKGTQQALDKLFRSTKVQNQETIEVYEEWALKLSDFGNSIEQVSTEFVLEPEQNSGEVVVARLNYIPDSIGFVKQINILNAENRYKNIPRILVALPDAVPNEPFDTYDPLIAYSVGSVVMYADQYGNPCYYRSLINQPPSTTFNSVNWQAVLITRRAQAYAILDSQGIISRVDITDPGYGYTLAPAITIDSGTEDHSLDFLYSVWQGSIVKDETLDNIINIDIDQPNVWTVRPPEPTYSLKLPETDIIDYAIPNAGYVHFGDVDYHSFDPVQLTEQWAVESFNPTTDSTIWVAKTFTGDWSVYKLTSFSALQPGNSWKLLSTEAGELILGVPTNRYIVPQNWTTPQVNSTDFGNMLVIQQVDNGIANEENSFTVGFIPYQTTNYASPGTYTDPDTLLVYNAYALQTLDGTPITVENIPNFDAINTLLVYKTRRFRRALARATITAGAITTISVIDGGTGYSTPPTITITGNGTGATATAVIDSGVVIGINIINAGSGYTKAAIDISIPQPAVPAVGEKLWIDNYQDNRWSVIFYRTVAPYVVYRQQESLIDSSLFQSASIYSKSTTDQLVRLPIYDPFKNILPGSAKQNLTYISKQDPARYNITGNQRLFSENLNFTTAQVGQLWWDLSDTRFVYYEQPTALDGSETDLESLIYRRNNWARLFPGSTIKIYEWVKSAVPPSEYTGSGIPKDTETYVEITTSNQITNITETSYYFWVQNTTDKPNIENRTLAAVDVAALLQNPKSQGYAFFCPIQQTRTNNSYLFYNVQEILSYRGNNVQIEYRTSQRDDQQHAQWMFLREGDANSLIPDRYWNKMVDSLCGYTKPLPVSDEYSNGIILPTEIVAGWNSLEWNEEDWNPVPEYVEILPVPDPTLGVSEKYGISYRPRQGMFVNLQAARKVFVQAANDLLKYIPIRDDKPNWDTNVPTSIYWDYTDWYLPGFENVSPTVVYSTVGEANAALVAGSLNLGDIVKVINGVAGRFVIYEVYKDKDTNVSTLREVGTEKSAIKLLDTVYKVSNLYGLSVELRQLLQAMRSEIMIDNYVVDQNQLFFSMLNYAVSEQKNLDWVFKSSYIYVKENNIPLVQEKTYTPEQTKEIISYIENSKPYHTQIKDYLKTYRCFDQALGTALDLPKMRVSIKFGPDTMTPTSGVWDADCYTPTTAAAWDLYAWDSCPAPVHPVEGNTYAGASGIFGSNTSLTAAVQQFISGESLPFCSVPLTFFDAGKRGYSNLFPYTFNFNSVNLNNPQTFITPQDVVSVVIGDKILIAGQDFYVEYDPLTTNYTAYLYNNPATNITPVAVVYLMGGVMQPFRYNTSRNEVAYGFPKDSTVINVDTKLPVIAELDSSGDPLTYYPTIVGWGTVWGSVSGSPVYQSIETAVIQAAAADGVSASTDVIWSFDPANQTDNFDIINSSITSSYRVAKQEESIDFYRNANEVRGVMIADLDVPTLDNYNIQEIIVDIDPEDTTPVVLPDPDTHNNCAVWINGERIEYRAKIATDEPNIWKLRLLSRGTKGTAVGQQAAGSWLFVEKDQAIVSTIPGETANQHFWALRTIGAGAWGDFPWASMPWSTLSTQAPDATSQILPVDPTYGIQYSRVKNLNNQGLWYGLTEEAEFINQKPGRSIS